MEKTLAQTPSNCLKIVLFGPESTGKTTLAIQLAEHYQEPWVPEYMRVYLEKKWVKSQKSIEKEDLLAIAEGQMNAENVLLAKAKKVLFLDTNLLEIKTYCEYYYQGFCPSEIKSAAAQNKYDHYFLTGIDVPWEFDDLRDRPNDREIMFRTFEKELLQNSLPYTILRGNQKYRLKKAITVIEELRKKN
ncbi:AAA family ATPase [Patiriisocius sp. Uisw_017]|jgi:HTH-type transcriptional repressor of NAD biosynthesis genes|uniref:AAA family ATPase n=1 Tax=Patiriisocius sp. Uisw_017 TaxID=3230968 RepID=UPI0039EBF9D7